MTAQLRTFECEDCGTVTRRKRQWNQRLICFDCGVTATIANSSAMFTRSGPQWEAHQRNPGGRPRKSPPPTE